MTREITRRDLLRAAGGITFLALRPAGSGLYAIMRAAAAPAELLPLFTALPYVQPGDASRLVDGSESIVVAWQTDGRSAAFRVEYGPTKRLGHSAAVTVRARGERDAEENEQRLNYAATIGGLTLGRTYHYRVSLRGERIADGYFTTRKPRGAPTRFVAFGDNSYGDISDRAIAYQAYRARPDFVMNTGDNVYEGGLDNEYARYFFPVYNADLAGPRIGAPLLRSVPFYSVIANHDVHAQTPDKGPAADFDHNPDSLAFFTNLYLPLNGPVPSQPPPTIGSGARVATFAACAGDRFPRMANYSFDYGDAHFLCLDANVYVDPTARALQEWIGADLAGTDATWRFVVYHHPAFNVGAEHYQAQHMRVLAPIFEAHGVDFVLSGHEHNYQRTRPLRFAPGDASRASLRNAKDRRVPGHFTVDTAFDGERVTQPNGVIYVTTGAGGKHLYDAGYGEDPSRWLHEDDGNVAYVARMVTDRHSLTVFQLDRHTATLRQMDQWGNEIDRIRVTRAR